MQIKPIDLRSDTVTRPTEEMRAAIATAEVGDDVFGDDPTVNLLQEQVAALLGKEAAIFVPSGTMSNQIGVRLHCGAGDEFLCDSECHIFNYEQGAFAQFFGISVNPLPGKNGCLTSQQVADNIRPPDDHQCRTQLLCLENTLNRGGGRILPLDMTSELCQVAHQRGLATHLDGARLFNAVVATGISAAQWAGHFDTVSVCFSKGLGAPIGSALCGPADLIRQARRHRKALGGGTRQMGVVAAAALYSLENHVERLAEDHKKASLLGKAVRAMPGLSLQPDQIDTNIVIFDIEPHLGTAELFCQRLGEMGVLMNPSAERRVRAVTHLDVSLEQIDRVIEAVGSVVTAAVAQPAVLENAG